MARRGSSKQLMKLLEMSKKHMETEYKSNSIQKDDPELGGLIDRKKSVLDKLDEYMSKEDCIMCSFLPAVYGLQNNCVIISGVRYNERNYNMEVYVERYEEELATKAREMYSDDSEEQSTLYGVLTHMRLWFNVGQNDKFLKTLLESRFKQYGSKLPSDKRVSVIVHDLKRFKMTDKQSGEEKTCISPVFKVIEGDVSLMKFGASVKKAPATRKRKAVSGEKEESKRKKAESQVELTQVEQQMDDDVDEMCKAHLGDDYPASL